jgi:diaminohydroxyphosphoribosylaminopyrimidine deaminase/5-amino-6-(5-phosphoribosylamino)uracil reductase
MTASEDQAAFDVEMMERAIELGRGGDPSPNPHVGAVIVGGHTVIAEGFHNEAGQDHAEVVAMKAAGAKARGKTLYVTL